MAKRKLPQEPYAQFSRQRGDQAWANLMTRLDEDFGSIVSALGEFAASGASGEQVLASAVANLRVASAQPLFLMRGGRALITRVFLVPTNISGVSVAPRVSVVGGVGGATSPVLMQPQTLSGLTTKTGFWNMSVVNGRGGILGNGHTLKLNVLTAATAADFRVQVIVFGIATP